VTDENEKPGISELGHWEGSVFHYKVPVEMPNGMIMKKVDVSNAVLEEGITAEDLVYALAHAENAEQIDDHPEAKFN
jgi:hypothetical protein